MAPSVIALNYIPNGIPEDQVVQAIFSATKELLSQERIQMIAESLPNEIRQLWEQA